MTPFHVGMKVTLIRNPVFAYGMKFPKLWPRLPEQGEVLTVREVGPSQSRPDRVNLKFEEIVCGIHPVWNAEVGWVPENFRPIVKTDISLLEEIARKVTQGKRVKIDA